MLIEADVVVTVDGAGRVLEPGWIRIDGAHIVAVGEGSAPAPDPGEPRRRGRLAMPGLVSAHQHLLDVMLRGATFGPTFLDWLLGLYYARLAHATPDECGLATSLALADTVRGGVTTVVDCWGLDGGDDPGRLLAAAEASLAVHRASGARVVFARMFAERVPDPWRAYAGPFGVDRLCAPADLALEQVARLSASHHRAEAGRILVTPSPELPELVTAEGFRNALALATDLDVVLPVHLFASPESRAACGPDELARMGVLDERLLAAHCIAVDDRDTATLAAAGVGVAHCPTANFALGDRTTPVARLRAAGIDVGLGLDNASLNPRADLFAEARRAVEAAGQGGAPLTAGAALAMATIEGARAVGLDRTIGSLEAGKHADVILLDTDREHWWPHDDWVSAIVTRARTSDVQTVIVDGRIVATDGRATELDVDVAAAQRAAARLRDLV